MNNLVQRITEKIGRDVITAFTRRRKDRIICVKESASGSNTYALWKLANEEIKRKYDIILYQDHGTNGVTNFVKKYKLLSSSQIIITTHASYKPSRKHIHMQLWHGALVKKNGVMEQQGDGPLVPPKSWLRADYIMSYSETYNTFMNACMITDPRKYVITGAPRNDFLFLSDGFANMWSVFGDEINGHQLLFFMPTFRDFYGHNLGNKEQGNPFGFADFSLPHFDRFLHENKFKLVFKPHPHEEQKVLEYLGHYESKNILLLRNQDLTNNKLDLYELINASSMLITDYSSIYFDYLLLDKPMIFIPIDIDSFSQNRGFLVESYDHWAPGPKVYDQESLQSTIIRCLEDPDCDKPQRACMTDLHHRFKDGNSAQRLWDFITESILD